MPTMNFLNSPPSAAVGLSHLARLATVAMLLGGTAVGAMAQTYKVVGPDGKITYTDKPPAAADIKAPPKSAAVTPGAPGVPFETRQAMAKYPVTLYTTKNCSACDNARQALRRRGIPFNEFTVNDDTDFAAYRSRFNATTFPGISVGSKNLAGFSPTDLSGYLDAAGYPAQTHLAGYTWPPAMPLVPASAKQAAAAADTEDAAPAAAASAPAPLLPPPSKSGIQF
jgi:glutaredoxin